MHKAVIVGGGIGGLTAALCLHHHGWHAEILEQASALEAVGAGIQISPNGVKVLRALGVADAIERSVFAPRDLQFRNGRTGAIIGRMAMGAAMEARYGAPYWHVHRADLIAALSAAVDQRMPGAVRTGVSVTRYHQDAHGIHAQSAQTERITGDVLIGADGIKSAIRAHMLGPAQPRFTGNVAWRAVVPVSQLGRHTPPPAATIWFGEGKHAVTYLLRGGTLANLVGVVERDGWTTENWREQGTRAQALADFAGWHPTITRIMEQAHAHHRWALFDRDPLPRWTDGRAALLGDACHPMLPFMAQGAVMAIEDSWVLAHSLSRQTDLPRALIGYQNARTARTARVQREARKNMGIFHRRTRAGKLATYGPLWLASALAPSLMMARNDWLYGHDVTG
ncbi:FAD-dependent monooxygenase [Pontixanthobacter sp.]|uniref:FAD-dependent monooxygenase n=1 Tax=Pontixanthobacter sp. TaxID=2792078 RepID=UPI003C7A3D9A